MLPQLLTTDIRVLLRYKMRCLAGLTGRVQHGHRERRRVSAMMSRRRMVATEFGM